MVKFEMVVLIGREKTDVVVDWILQPAARAVVGERERERKPTWNERE
jgi:hypothetical protein